MTNPLVTADPAVMLGKPVIAGTRITVELILEKLGAGETIDDLLLDYPQLTREAVAAALRFALQVMRQEVLSPLQRRRSWREIRSSVPFPLCGEDAQAWVRRGRQESEELREQQWRSHR